MSHRPCIRSLLLLLALSVANSVQAVRAQPIRPDAASVELSGIAPGGASIETVQLDIEEEPTGRMIPLLPFIFFDEGSSTIPARYLSADSAATVDPFVGAYRAIIDVVGKRMQSNPRERLVLTGTSSHTGRDRRAGLARARAVAVADRLASAFGIERSRLTVVAVRLPRDASNNAHVEGQSENRRVELSGSDVVLAPIGVGDTLARATSTGLRIMPSVLLPKGLAEWSIELRHDGGLFRRLRGEGSMRELYVEEFTESELRRFAASPTAIDATLRVYDSKRDSLVVPMRSIRFSVQRTRRALTAADGRPQDRESIVLFGFNNAELSEHSKIILRDLVARIAPTAQLRVTGYTDETGDSVLNQVLSHERAEAVRLAMPDRVASARGGGESGGHHFNSRPEDRFYSRAARVAVQLKN